MADYLTTDTELTSVANAIRTKGGTSAALVYPADFISAINAIQTGGTYQSKTVSPSESQQTVSPDSGYDALSFVTVNAISSSYVGSGITRRSSTDLTASGATVTAPAGYYASSASKSIANGSASTPATTITANPTISVNSSTGLITASNSKTQSVTPTVSAGYVSSGTAGTITVSGSNTSQLSVQAAQTITPTTTDQTIAAGKYLTGTQTIKGDANLVAANIADGVTIFGITGTHQGGSTNLIFTNVLVEASNFVYTEEFEDFGYEAEIPLNGVTSNMIPFVTYSVEDATSGDYAPVAKTYNGGIYIYSDIVPGTDLIIPTIFIST